MSGGGLSVTTCIKYAFSPVPVAGSETIDAENMLHLKFTRRLHRLRGHSLLSGIPDPPGVP